MSGSVVGITATDTIRLKANDTNLIGNAANGVTATITDCSNGTLTATIAANLCPISDTTSGLLPYKVK